MFMAIAPEDDKVTVLDVHNALWRPDDEGKTPTGFLVDDDQVSVEV